MKDLATEFYLNPSKNALVRADHKNPEASLLDTPTQFIEHSPEKLFADNNFICAERSFISAEASYIFSKARNTFSEGSLEIAIAKKYFSIPRK